jgi:hypothetical protein
MTEKKTDVLNLRLDAALAREIERIAAWRGKTESEVARELLHYGIRVERDLEAQELRRRYDWGPVDRNAENVEIEVRGSIKFLSYRELAEREAELDEEKQAADEYDYRQSGP